MTPDDAGTGPEAGVDGVGFHNAPERRRLPSGAVRLARLPETVRDRLSAPARAGYARPTGVELRFVGDGPVTVRLSAPEGGRARARTSWGPFRHGAVDLGPEPRPVTVARPARVRALDGAGTGSGAVTDAGGVAPAGDAAPAPASGGFSPALGRLRVRAAGPLVVHGVTVRNARRPTVAAAPDRTLLAVGTSITEGAGPRGAPGAGGSYARWAARRLGWDLLNLGCTGAGLPDPALAAHVAGRDDWDAAVVEPAGNAVDRPPAATRERLRRTLDAVAGDDGRPVVVLDPPTQWRDLPGAGADARAAVGRCRDAVAAAVEAAPPTCRPVDGTALDAAGLSADLLHPTDAGAATLGRHVADGIASLLG